MSARNLAYQIIKYKERSGWSHRDLIRLAHVKTSDKNVNDVLRYAVKGELPEITPSMDDPLAQIHHPPFDQIAAAELAKKTTSSTDIAWLIRTFDLPRECIPTQFLKEKIVWEALLEKMPMTALVRNLATLSRIGLLTPMSEAAQKVVAELGNEERLRKARIHPIQLLSALRVYSAGGQNVGYYTVTRSKGAPFTPLPQINAALE